MRFSAQQGKTVKSNSGFSGRGFKFDETEQVLAKERKQIQKAALGLQDSDDEDAGQDVSILLRGIFSIFTRDFSFSGRVFATNVIHCTVSKTVRPTDKMH